MYSEAYTVWDNGHVLSTFVWEPEEEPDAEWKKLAIMRLMDCNSGRFVLVSRAPDGGIYQLPTRQHETLNEIEDGETITLNRFQRKMKRAGAATRRFADSDETCICSVHFPELRGKKNPYRGTRG